MLASTLLRNGYQVRLGLSAGHAAFQPDERQELSRAPVALRFDAGWRSVPSSADSESPCCEHSNTKNVGRADGSDLRTGAFGVFASRKCIRRPQRGQVRARLPSSTGDMTCGNRRDERWMRCCRKRRRPPSLAVPMKAA